MPDRCWAGRSRTRSLFDPRACVPYSSFPLSASAGKARYPSLSRAQCFRVWLSLTLVGEGLVPPWEGGRSIYTVHIAPVHSLTYALPRRNEKERGRVFQEMIKTEIDVWVRPRPDPPGTFDLVRIASALAAELMGRGKKKEREKWAMASTPLSRFVCDTFLFRLGSLDPTYYPRGQRARDTEARLSPAPHSSYATIISGGKRLVAPSSLYLRLSNGRQHNIPRTLSSAMDGKLLTVRDRDVTFSEKGNINSCP